MRVAFESLFRHLGGSQGISLLSAPAGLGKTLLCRKLAELLQQTADVAFLPNALFSTPRAFLQAVLYELGQPYSRMGEQELRLALHSAIKSGFARDRGFVLMVDEAHLLTARILEEARSLTNFGDGGRHVVSVLLSGQLELEEQLARPGFEAFNQRIVCHATLESLTQSESVDYVEYRIKQAGGDVGEILSPDAFRTICQVSDGVPRCLNQLSDHTLMLAMAAGEKPASDETVRAALEDLKQLPLRWNEPPRKYVPAEPKLDEEPKTEFVEYEVEYEPENENDGAELETSAQVIVESGAVEQTAVEFGENWNADEQTIEPALDDDSTYSLVDTPASKSVPQQYETPVAAATDVVEFGFDDESPCPAAPETTEIRTAEIETAAPEFVAAESVATEAIEAEAVAIEETIEVAGDTTEPAVQPEFVESECAIELATDELVTDSFAAEPECVATPENDTWEWEPVDLNAVSGVTATYSTPEISVGVTAPIPRLAESAGEGVETSATWAVGLPTEETVEDHYVALEIQLESTGRVAADPLRPSLECETALVGLEPASSDGSEAERLLRQLLIDPTENAMRPVSIIDRVALLVQDLTGLGVGEAAELECGNTSTTRFDTSNCPTTGTVLLDKSRDVEAWNARSQDDQSTIAFQVSPRQGNRPDFEVPSQIVMEPGLGTGQGVPPADQIEITLADALQETRQLIKTVHAALSTRFGTGEPEAMTETSSFDTSVRSPYWTQYGEFDSEIERYDVVMPEVDDDTVSSAGDAARFSTLFSDLNEGRDDA